MAVKLPKKKPIPPTPVEPKHGNLYPASTMFFRVDAGTAKDEKGNKYELSTNVGGGNPIIRNITNGRSWSMTWSQLLGLAIQDGITAPLTKEEKASWGWAAKEPKTKPAA